ncbi:MAG: baseplate J/gp47 family protein, partial [Methylococcales bacterium]|nr:baseplate J/gp47 family protein [Methylococcales bacterium]
LSVDVPIQSLSSGSFGNVSPQSITNCPSRPSGVDGVINYEQTSGGTDDETDIELRARVPLYLGSLSKAIEKPKIEESTQEKYIKLFVEMVGTLVVPTFNF